MSERPWFQDRIPSTIRSANSHLCPVKGVSTIRSANSHLCPVKGVSTIRSAGSHLCPVKGESGMPWSSQEQGTPLPRWLLLGTLSTACCVSM